MNLQSPPLSSLSTTTTTYRFTPSLFRTSFRCRRKTTSSELKAAPEVMLSLRKSQQFQHDPANLAARARERMEFEAAAEAVTRKMGKRKSIFLSTDFGCISCHKVTVHDRKRDVLRAMQRILTPRKSKFDSNNEDSTEESIRTDVICWKNLRTLAITFGRFDDDLFRSIISGSPVLETLVLDSCYGFEVLDISNDSVKNFVICGYSSEMDTLRINAPHIESLTIKGDFDLKAILLIHSSVYSKLS
ncbi:ubiquitin-activating enzyme E1 1-like protein isoform X2 [Tanacetum coccineum]